MNRDMHQIVRSSSSSPQAIAQTIYTGPPRAASASPCQTYEWSSKPTTTQPGQDRAKITQTVGLSYGRNNYMRSYRQLQSWIAALSLSDSSYEVQQAQLDFLNDPVRLQKYLKASSGRLALAKNKIVNALERISRMTSLANNMSSTNAEDRGARSASLDPEIASSDALQSHPDSTLVRRLAETSRDKLSPLNQPAAARPTSPGPADLYRVINAKLEEADSTSYPSAAGAGDPHRSSQTEYFNGHDNAPGTPTKKEEEDGVEMLLMMRRNRNNQHAPLPAPLSQAAIKSRTGPSAKSSSAITPHYGMPSSHPYYRSDRVLASPALRSGAADHEQVRHPELQHYNLDKRSPAMRTTSQDQNRPRENRTNVRYEQQRLRKPTEYRQTQSGIDIPPAHTREALKDDSRDKAATSPRVFIPPPIFSPRHGPLARPMLHNRALSDMRPVPHSPILRHGSAMTSRPPSAPSQAEARVHATEQLHHIHQPYKSGSRPPTARRLSPPRYQDYFDGLDRPIASPIRESFVRSSNTQTGISMGYRQDGKIKQSATRSPPNRTAQQQVLRAPSNNPLQPAVLVPGFKRPAPENQDSSRHRGLRYIAPHSQQSSNVSLLSADHVMKRARTDSIESSNSGSIPSQSDTSPPNRLRLIAPVCAGPGSNMARTQSDVSNLALQHHKHMQRERSPALIREYPAGPSEPNRGNAAGSAGVSGVLGALLAEVTSGGQSNSETAKALADVAMSLSQVAERLRQ